MKTQKTDYIPLLQKMITNLLKMQKSLNRSHTKCKAIGFKETYTEAEEDIIDNLISRFGRLTDYLINKIYRTIDKIEYTMEGTILDLFNRAHKRGLINSVEELKEIKELRNITAHEYTNEELDRICEDVFNHIPILMDLTNRVIAYCQKQHGCT